MQKGRGVKLIINRSQTEKKGMLGGHKGVDFTLGYRLELTEEEKALVDKYKLHFYPLTWETTPTGEQRPGDTISSMMEGRSQTLGDVTTLISNEEVIKNACDQLPPLFSVARSFGGDEVIEYPRIDHGASS
jgi:hypothetical protein